MRTHNITYYTCVFLYIIQLLCNYHIIYSTKSIASVRPFVLPSVRPSVRSFVRPSVRPFETILLANARYNLQTLNLHALAYMLKCTYPYLHVKEWLIIN